MTEIIPLNPSPRPAPPRREAPPILALGTKVYVRPTNDHPGTGTIRGVTYKAQPVYDVRLEDGRWLRGLAADQVEAL